MTARVFAAIGTGACVAAVLFAATAAGFRAIDRELSTYTTEIRNVPAEWAGAYYEDEL